MFFLGETDNETEIMTVYYLTYLNFPHQNICSFVLIQLKKNTSSIARAHFPKLLLSGAFLFAVWQVSKGCSDFFEKQC